eukprot:7856562-Pyramimonas_sp.AAC.1
MAEAAANAGGHDNARLHLDLFTRSSPHGWTDLDEAQWGPAICGRLKGQVFQFAMSLRSQRLDPNTGQFKMMEALELFVEPATAEGPGTPAQENGA